VFAYSLKVNARTRGLVYLPGVIFPPGQYSCAILNTATERVARLQEAVSEATEASRLAQLSFDAAGDFAMARGTRANRSRRD